MATNSNLPDGDAGVTLKECETWLKEFKLKGRAIDIRGKLIWSYDPPVLNKKIPGGNTYRLLIHNEHVWLINKNIKEFTTLNFKTNNINNNNNKTIIPGDIRLLELKSVKWRRQLKRDVTYRFVSNCDDVHHTSVDARQDGSVEDEIILSNNVEQLFIDLWNKGFEGAKLRLDQGVIQSFIVRIQSKIYQINSSISPETTTNLLIL
jgi:hypothetical protein